MRINLKELALKEGAKEEISYSFSVNLQESLGVGKPEETKINVTGTADNTLGYFTVLFNTSFTLPFVCDRCLKETQQVFEYYFSHEFSLESSEDLDEKAYIDKESMLDLDALVIADIGLSLPSKFLCEQGCKGICPVCGQNLNERECNCDTTEIDPRLEALKQLLK